MENTPRISCCTYSPITPLDIIPKPVLGIRDILERNRIGRSVHLTNGSGSTDQYLWLTNLDPTPDQTPFFSDFKDAKKKFLNFFSYNLPSILQIPDPKLYLWQIDPDPGGLKTCRACRSGSSFGYGTPTLPLTISANSFKKNSGPYLLS